MQTSLSLLEIYKRDPSCFEGFDKKTLKILDKRSNSPQTTTQEESRIYTLMELSASSSKSRRDLMAADVLAKEYGIMVKSNLICD